MFVWVEYEVNMSYHAEYYTRHFILCALQFFSYKFNPFIMNEKNRWDFT